MKVPTPVNIPKDKKDQFKEVAFVEGMTEYRLKVFIKRIWQQLMSMANVFDGKRRDVPLILDKIMGGQRWNQNDVYDRFQYGLHPKFTIQYDTLKKEFKLLDVTTRQPLGKPIKAISISDAKMYMKNKKNILGLFK